jgi:hypothetical protein
MSLRVPRVRIERTCSGLQPDAFTRAAIEGHSLPVTIRPGRVEKPATSPEVEGSMFSRQLLLSRLPGAELVVGIGPTRQAYETRMAPGTNQRSSDPTIRTQIFSVNSGEHDHCARSECTRERPPRRRRRHVAFRLSESVELSLAVGSRLRIRTCVSTFREWRPAASRSGNAGVPGRNRTFAAPGKNRAYRRSTSGTQWWRPESNGGHTT